MNRVSTLLSGPFVPPPGHLWSVHILRGIAALLVVCEHIIGRPPYPEFNRLFAWLDGLGHFGVVCFFVISGFVLPRSLGPEYSPKHFGRFLLRRAIRIEPTYLAAVLLTAASVFLVTRIAPGAIPWTPSLPLIIQHAFYLIPFTDNQWLLPVFWTLAVEFQFYLAIGLLYPIMLAAHRLSPTFGYATAVAFSFLVLLAPMVPQVQLLKYSPYFSLGLLLDRHCHARLPLARFVASVAGVSAVALMAGHHAHHWSIGVLTVLLILLWRAAGPMGGKFQRLLVVLGSLSYSWYVIHQLVANLGETTARFIAGRPSFSMQTLAVNLVPVAAFVGSLLAAWLLYKTVEKPTHEMARRLPTRRTSPV